ncbi:hypothetical protein RvY_12346-1 [Ramazzottius varieornatus]|uniref:Uncharacterized protein n=1 Tax=Ramazzottius varieornatus TaxID=947166 RepID=A0A1D1VL74_RAMVA|nr:hypothetical protein RvY_12346-1 [Ramazzottius varieornatus]
MHCLRADSAHRVEVQRERQKSHSAHSQSPCGAFFRRELRLFVQTMISSVQVAKECSLPERCYSNTAESDGKSHSFIFDVFSDLSLDFRIANNLILQIRRISIRRWEIVAVDDVRRGTIVTMSG